VGLGSDVTDATILEAPNEERPIADKTFVKLPTRSFRVEDFWLNVLMKRKERTKSGREKGLRLSLKRLFAKN
jgi:hypothetical protein